MQSDSNGRGSKTQFYVNGMDCADDAAEIEAAVSALGVTSPKVSTASQVLTLPEGAHPVTLERLTETVSQLGYHLQPMGGGEKRIFSAGYQRALWIVVVLNLAFGIAEMVGGFIADSQALKADSLDFLGDGLITFLGLAAIGWDKMWRARSALIQGLFLGALGLSVITTTVYRIAEQRPPEAEIMGGLGLVALLVNVAAAWVLIPHRSGDANARAVWLFSRNDAIGNAAVIVAAGLVAWTDTAWPDLLVALVIAGLFLSSSFAIIRDSVREIRSDI